jgi:thioredoxin:protein disulfide reductase
MANPSRWSENLHILRWTLPLLLLIVAGCDTGGDDSFTYLMNRYGIAGGILGSYLGGLLVSLTPCVYPMIVITVSVFGANPTESRRRAMFLSLSFVLGLCAMYTPLGVVAGLTGGLFGAALASPWVLGGIVLILLGLAASMFGFWELALPSSLQTRLSTVGGVGFWGAFLMGLVAGILAAPCAGPVTIALLTFVGTSGDPVGGALYFFFYALGIGTLFFLVGAFALSLPMAGRWTEWVKSVFGVVILVMAGWYLRLLIPGANDVAWNELWAMIAGGVAVVLGLALGAVHLSPAGEGWAVRFRKIAAVLLVAAGATVIVLGLFAVEVELIPWRDDYEAAEVEARSQGRPIVIDFTADWCGACQELAHQTFADRSVAAEAERFATIRVDATRQTEEIERYMERFRVAGLPTVIVIDSSGEESGRITEFVPPERMLELLRAAR